MTSSTIKRHRWERAQRPFSKFGGKLLRRSRKWTHPCSRKTDPPRVRVVISSSLKDDENFSGIFLSSSSRVFAGLCRSPEEKERRKIRTVLD